MKVKIKNHLEFGVKKDDVVNITKDIGDYYIGTFVDKRGVSSIIRIKKANCTKTA